MSSCTVLQEAVEEWMREEDNICVGVELVESGRMKRRGMDPWGTPEDVWHGEEKEQEIATLRTSGMIRREPTRDEKED